MKSPADDKFVVQTKPICPECGQEIPTDGIAVEKDSAWCPACHREMSLVDVADYSIVQAKRKEPLPSGFTVISDTGDTLTITFKSARLGLRIFGVIFSALAAIPIPWAVYHMAVGHCKSYAFAVGLVFVLTLFLIWILWCLRNEWMLHMVFQFKRGRCSCFVRPTFFKPSVREFTFDRDTVFGLVRQQIQLFSPCRPPEVVNLLLPMTADQVFHLYCRFLDFKYGISAGTFKVGAPNPSRKPPMTLNLPRWRRIVNWVWFVFVVAILIIQVVMSILEWGK